MRRRLGPPALALCLALALLAGCGIGSDDASAPDSESDLPGAMLACFDEAGVEGARLDGEQQIVVGEGPDAPRVVFFLTAGEAEARAFEGRGEGAEQIGAALLYVGDGDGETLEAMENCLADQ